MHDNHTTWPDRTVSLNGKFSAYDWVLEASQHKTEKLKGPIKSVLNVSDCPSNVVNQKNQGHTQKFSKFLFSNHKDNHGDSRHLKFCGIKLNIRMSSQYDKKIYI